MPELPDITVYCEHIEKRVLGNPLRGVTLNSPFVLRTAVPPIGAVTGRKVTGVNRSGKRIVLSLEGELHLVIHLMIAGRLHWNTAGKNPGRRPLAALEFPDGWLTLTEAGTKRRASIHLVQGAAALAAMNPGGLEPLTATREEFVARLLAGNHTLKRALTDPRLFSGIGNAYSDEILHRARLSPIAMTRSLGEEEKNRLFEATRQVLTQWTQRLRKESGEEFPEKITAFREGFAVHGRYGKPCPVCGSPVQRIVYAENETNYCARCQTGGKLLADRSLSRLLKKSWPKSIDELG
ncbi:MAG TPA: DNA-formamidopyrimidine glycosylase family protein [Burkholderiales bacterium]|jgi:formamidopyrimidine-DNA glycosylase|nr:DNA-formamidopyrimidine glycosylase family protein [Burkholderiales bacterium]